MMALTSCKADKAKTTAADTTAVEEMVEEIEEQDGIHYVKIVSRE